MGMHKNTTRNGGTPIFRVALYAFKAHFNSSLCNYYGFAYRNDNEVETF
jgi:hypothetical protein